VSLDLDRVAMINVLPSNTKDSLPFNTYIFWIQGYNSEIKMEKYYARLLSPTVVGDCFQHKMAASWSSIKQMYMVKIEMYVSLKMNLVYVWWVSK
jgi:hypothetical protein